jgi:hypothetical protein
MYVIVYKGLLNQKANFHTIAASFAEAIENFKESTSKEENAIISIVYWD